MAVSSFFSGMGDVVFTSMNSQLFGNNIPGVYVFIHREHGTTNISTKTYAASTDNMLVIRSPSSRIRRGSFRNYLEFHGVCRQISGIVIEPTYGTQAFLHFESNEDSVYQRDDIGAPLPHRFQDEFMKGLLFDHTSLNETGSTISFGVVIKSCDLSFEATGFKFCQLELALRDGRDRQTLIGIQLPCEDDCGDVPSNSLLSQPLDIELVRMIADQRSLARNGLILLANYTLPIKDTNGDKFLSESDSDDENSSWKTGQLSPSTEESIGLTQHGQFAAGTFENWLSCFRTSRPILLALTKVTYLLAKQRNNVKQRLHVLLDTENYVLRVQKAWEQENNTKAKNCRSDKHNFEEVILGDEATIGIMEAGFNAQVMENWLVSFASDFQRMDKIVARLAAYLREEVRNSMSRLRAVKEAFEYAEKRKDDWKAQIDRRQSSETFGHGTNTSSHEGLRRPIRRYGRGQRAAVAEVLSRNKRTAVHGVDGRDDVKEELDVKMKRKERQETEADDSDASMDSDNGGVAVNGYMLSMFPEMAGTAKSHPVAYPSALLPLPSHMQAMTGAQDYGNVHNDQRY